MILHHPTITDIYNTCIPIGTILTNLLVLYITNYTFIIHTYRLTIVGTIYIYIMYTYVYIYTLIVYIYYKIVDRINSSINMDFDANVYGNNVKLKVNNVL